MYVPKPFITLLCILAIGYGAYAWIRRQMAATIWTIPIAVASSPGGVWRAWVDETVVEDTFVTSIFDEVHLVAKNDPDKVINVLAVDTNGEEQNRPSIAWTAPSALQVTAANLSYVTVERRAYKQVRIDLKFDPDDPAARAAWLKRLDERDGGAGQASTATR